ncbi:MAG TPA: NAD regulator [Caulobacteraceae bacterium]|nr:NAD regulator [Caulobacteraceae bacterium]
MTTTVVIGLSAVIIAMAKGEATVLTVRPRSGAIDQAGDLQGLPFGPFDPDGHRTFELALREFVTRQTRFELGYVEQLYTFGDKGRDAPVADVGAGSARVISVGYLALAPFAAGSAAPDTRWSPWSQFFPWEDWRGGRPTVIPEVIAPALRTWAQSHPAGWTRAAQLFALEGWPWNEERVLDRYELLYEAGLVPEAARDRGGQADAAGESPAAPSGLGEPMISDHRRILATALGRLRGKIKYRPVIFELMGEAFTLSALQKTVEAVSGVTLHKQNFRRMLERTELVEGLGRMNAETGGRPAELFRFRRERMASGPAPGLTLPVLMTAAESPRNRPPATARRRT